MTIIHANNIVVQFPVYGMVDNRSIKKSLVNIATGGVLAKEAGNRVLVRALDELNFKFQEGDRVGLMGHNGSGKSTLLQVLAGIYEPDSGELIVNGKITSMLGITLGMDGDVTGLENIYLRGRLMGLSLSKIDVIVDDIAEFAGLGGYLHLPMRTYSSGMAMRLAFAIATSIKADIILMDEWMSVGDADFSLKANERLNKLMSYARLVVIASHNDEMILAQGNKIMTLEHGKILFIG